MSQTDTTSATRSSQQDPHEARQPSHAQRRLDVAIGTWKVEGRNDDAAPASPGQQVSGQESYEWMPGGFFLLCRWDRRIGSQRHTGMAVIGHDPDSRSYSSQSFDNLGYHRGYDMTVGDHSWTFSGKYERAHMTFAGDGRGFTVTWEISKDGERWLSLCKLQGTKLDG
jgi:hypothetical protein